MFLSDGISATRKLTDAKFYVPVVTFPTKDNEKLAKQFGDGFECSVHCNKYQTMPTEVTDDETNIYIKSLIGFATIIKTLFQMK